MKLLAIFILLRSSLSFAMGPCRYADPDDFFDNIGAVCVDYDSPTLDVGTREDWGSGQLSFSIGTGDDIIRTATAMPNGRILAAGRVYVGTVNYFFAVRFDLDGTLDATWNGTGKVQMTIGTQDAIPHRVILLTSGNLFFAGRSQNPTNLDFMGARFNTNGTLDTTFNATGFTQTSFGTAADIGRAVGVDSFARPYVAGYSFNASGYYEGAVVRYNTNGSLDTTFRTTGKAILNPISNFFGILSSQIDSLDRLTWAGTGYSTNWQILAGRLKSDGTLDTSFATIGYTILSIGTNQDSLYTMQMFGDKIILSGAYHNGTNMDLALIRLMSNGALDTSFNATGKLGQSFSTGDDYAYDMQVGAGGDIIVTGYGSRTNQDFLTVRYNSNGLLDTSFVTTGFQFSSVSSTNEQANAIYVTSSGQIFPIGRVIQSGANSDVAIIRYSDFGTVASSGTLDDSFGTQGVSTNDPGSLYVDAKGIAIMTNGRLVLMGSANNAFTFIRVSQDGAFDTSFGTDGIQINNPTGGAYPDDLELSTSGKVYAFGCGQGAGDPHVLRITTNGNLDTSFFTLGYRRYTTGAGVNANCQHGAVDWLDRPISFDYWGGIGRTRIARLATNGALDAAFGTAGIATFPNFQIYYGAIDPATNKLVIGGINGGSTPQIGRLNTNGSVDTSFKTTGSSDYAVPAGSGPMSGIAVSPNGRIVGGAPINVGAGTDYVRVVRVESSGAYDTSFNTNGYKDISIQGDIGTYQQATVYIQANDKILVDTQKVDYVSYARLNSNGTLDTSFNTTGRIDTARSGNNGYKFKVSQDGRICAASTGNLTFTSLCFWP